MTRLFVIVGGLVVLALITALVAPHFIDWNQYAGDFEREASRILGQRVTVSGNVNARLLPFPSVTFEDVVVGDTENPLMKADRFSMDAELAPFMRGETLIFDMRLENPSFTLEVDERGLPNWSLPDTGPVSPAKVTLENARIFNGTIHLHDAIDNRSWDLTGFDASVSADSLFGPFKIDAGGRLNDVPLGLRINTGALDRQGFSLKTVLDMPSQGIELTVDGRLGEPKTADDAPYKGTFTIRPRRVTDEIRYVIEGEFAASPRAVDVSEYRGEFGSSGDPYVVTGSAGIGGVDPRYHVEVTGTQVNLPTEGAGKGAAEAPAVPGLSVADRLALIRSTLAALPLPPVPGSINVDLPAVVAGDTAIRDIRLVASPDDSEGSDARRRWKVSQFEAQLPGRTVIQADGVLQLPLAGGDQARNGAGFSGNLTVASRQPSGLATWLTGSADDAIRRLTGAGFAARVDITGIRQSIEDLEVVLGPARMSGSLVRESDPARRSTLDIKLAGDGIDFDALEALAAVFIGDDGVSRFADHDLDLGLDLKNPDIRGVKLDTLEAAIRSRDRTTEIDRLLVTGLYGASVAADGKLEQEVTGMRANGSVTVLAADGAQLIDGLAQRFPDAGPLATLRAIAARDGAAFSDTRLDMVGTADLKKAISGEASLSISGATGGTKLSVTATAAGDAKDLESAKVQLNASFDNDKAERLFAQAGLRTFSIGGAGPASLEASIDGSLFDGMKSKFALTGDDMTAGVDGILTTDVLSTGFTGQLLVEANDIEPWAQALGYALPGMGLGTTADISAAISRRNGKTVLREISADLNASRVTGELTINTPDAVPVVRGDLAIEYLDAGQLYATVTGDAGAVIRVADADEAMRREFGPPILPDNDIEIGLSAGEVTFPAGDLTLDDFKSTLVYRGGAMTLEDITAGLAGGRVEGSVTIRNDAGSALLSARVSANDLPIGAVLPEVAQTVSGKAGFAVQVSGSGRSNEALLSSLAGSGVLSTGPLAVSGIRSDGFAEMIARANELGYAITDDQKENIAGAAFLGGESVLPAADYPISMASGELRITNATSRTGQMTISTDAAARLRTGELTANVRLSVDPGDEGVAGSLPEVALAFRSNGEGGFVVTRNLEPVTGYLTQRALEREQARVEALQARLLERQRLRREARLFEYRKRMKQKAIDESPLPLDQVNEETQDLDPAQLREYAGREAARRMAAEEIRAIDFDPNDPASAQDVIRGELAPVQ